MDNGEQPLKHAGEYQNTPWLFYLEHQYNICVHIITSAILSIYSTGNLDDTLKCNSVFTNLLIVDQSPPPTHTHTHIYIYSIFFFASQLGKQKEQKFGQSNHRVPPIVWMTIIMLFSSHKALLL